MALGGSDRIDVPYGRDQPCHTSKLSARLAGSPTMSP